MLFYHVLPCFTQFCELVLWPFLLLVIWRVYPIIKPSFFGYPIINPTFVGGWWPSWWIPPHRWSKAKSCRNLHQHQGSQLCNSSLLAFFVRRSYRGVAESPAKRDAATGSTGSTGSTVFFHQLVENHPRNVDVDVFKKKMEVEDGEKWTITIWLYIHGYAQILVIVIYYDHSHFWFVYSHVIYHIPIFLPGTFHIIFSCLPCIFSHLLYIYIHINI